MTATRVARSPTWKLRTDSWFWIPCRVLVKKFRVSLGMDTSCGGGVWVVSGMARVGIRALEDTGGIVGSAAGRVAVLWGRVAPAAGSTGLEETPVVAMVSDTRLLRRRSLLRRKYGGETGT
jgi:hypothetical protein